MVMWLLPEGVQQRMPRVVKAWFRCYVMAMALCVSLSGPLQLRA